MAIGQPNQPKAGVRRILCGLGNDALIASGRMVTDSIRLSGTQGEANHTIHTFSHRSFPRRHDH